ncbi:MAG: serine/threonine-protein kinase [Polyangiaceae bacterium]
MTSPSPLPRKFARYTLFDFVGRGGMAEIYLGRSTTELGAARLSVVKLILSEYAALPKFAEMLTFEAKLAAQLSHANVVQVFDLGRENDQLFIAMEYVEGFDLNALLRRCSKQKIPLPVEFGLFIVACALRGLDYAHRRTDDTGRPLGIVHRDVSPSNLLISFEGEVKLCDFGIAHANDAMTNLIEAPVGDGATPYRQPEENLSEALQGKAGYMSPEHARGEVIDARADVFAAGIVLWELLAGRRLYKIGDGSNGTSLLEIARKAEIPAFPARGLPHEEKLVAIVNKALAKDKADRYASASAMLKDLEGYAIDARAMASPLKLGEWMAEHFGAEVIERRRARERGAAAIAKGPLVVLTPIASPKIEEKDLLPLKDVSSSALLNDPSSGDVNAPTKEPSPTPSDVRKVSSADDLHLAPVAVAAPLAAPTEGPMAAFSILVRVLAVSIVGLLITVAIFLALNHG